MKILALALCVIAITSCAFTQPLLPAEFTLSDRKVSCENGAFTSTVKRSYSTLFEASLIQTAEKIPPKGCPSDKWWHREVDGIKVSCAVTDEAISYYDSVIRNYCSNGVSPIPMKRATFTYTAEVARQDSYQLSGKTYDDVYVVKLKTSFSQYCGSLCALYAGSMRMAVFSSKGELLAVEGDEATPVMVS